MALTIEIEVSPSASHADAAFVPLVTLPDSGAGFSFDHSADPTLLPDQLVLYRARRRDDSQPPECEYSDWTYAYGRAGIPGRETDMNAEDITTGVETALYVGIERLPGIPVKVTDQAAYTTGGINRDFRRVFSRRLRNARTMRRQSVGGMVTWEGSFTIEVSPEGAFPRFLLMACPVATTVIAAGGGAPETYRHRFVNGFGSKTATIVHRKGDTVFVYPGCRISRLEIAVSADADNVLALTFDVIALDELVYELAKAPTILTDCGIAAAGEDALDVYSQQDAELTVGGAVGGTRSLTFSLAGGLNRRKVGDGTRGASGTFEGLYDATGSGVAFWDSNENLYRDFGLAAAPTAGFAIGDSITEAAVMAVFTPPTNAAGYSNVLTLAFPKADVRANHPVNGPDEVPENLTFAPIDAIGEASGTDFYIEVTNEENNAALTTPSAPFVGTTAFENGAKSEARVYEYGVVTGSPTTTVFAAAANDYLSAVNDKYNGRTVRFLSGALAGQERTVIDYVGNSRTFTVGTALGQAPAVGDVFALV